MPAPPSDHAFIFIRSASAVPFVSVALNPKDWSSSSSLTSMNAWLLTSPQLHTQKVDPARQGALGSRFASPHTVRSSLDQPLQSSARFGSVFRCARSEYHLLTAHLTKGRQISSPQVRRSHNPLVAGSSPARPTLKGLVSRYLRRLDRLRGASHRGVGCGAWRAGGGGIGALANSGGASGGLYLAQPSYPGDTTRPLAPPVTTAQCSSRPILLDSESAAATAWTSLGGRWRA